jgi:uncharacterized protein (DUF2147 family)
MANICRLSVIIFITLFFTGYAASPGDSILGMWQNMEGTACFDFYKAGGEYRARQLGLLYPDLIDTLNPVDSLKTRRLYGATVLAGLKYDTGKNKWENGKVYNCENGRTYSCQCTMTDNGKKLRLRGYLGISVLGITKNWVRPTDDTERKIAKIETGAKKTSPDGIQKRSVP